MASQTNTTCPYCGVGCGLTVTKQDQGVPVMVQASESHPANFGRACSKGSALAETLDPRFTPERITHPTIDDKPVSWDRVTEEIASRIQDTIQDYGPQSVAFYLSGQLLTEDYYVANKLAKGFLGTANVDTNSRLCMSSAVAGYKRAFGSDTVPLCYEDLELADLIVLVGSNAAWTHPVLYQRMVAAKEANPEMRIVLVDPRKTATADLADHHLKLTPSSDNFLFQGLLNYLIEKDEIDQNYIDSFTQGFEDLIESVQGLSLELVADQCGLDVHDLESFYALFANTPKAVTFYSQGINQSASGTDKCNAIINCHLATGRIGKQGAGPFSITGQPNAMGGREVGGLANMLAAHMDFDPQDVERVSRFWQSKSVATQPGLKAIDMFDAVAEGDIKFIWVMATNPTVSLPDSNKIRRALEKCPTVVVSDLSNNDTIECADIVLPALGWGEKDGTVTNSERRISRQRAFVEGPGLAKPDWWAITKVARKLGFDSQFNFDCAADIFREHAQLSGFENNGSRDFDISGLADLDNESYDAMQAIQWPVNESNPSGTKRMFTDNRFYTKSGRANFIVSNAKLAKSVENRDAKRLILNTGRLRDQWHTMTRTGHSPLLSAHSDIASVYVHPEDALRLGLQDHVIAKASNEYGQALLQVIISNWLNSGQVFAPIHWTDQFAENCVVNRLTPPIVDPVSGQPEFKAINVDLQPFELKRWARVVSKQALTIGESCNYWTSSRFQNGYVTSLGYNEELDWQLLFNPEKSIDQTDFINPIQQSRSLIFSSDTSIETVVFEHRCASKLPSRPWLVSLFDLQDPKRAANMLRGEQDGRDELVCACFGTTIKAISAAKINGVKTTADLGAELGCGSKCGSCKPELNTLMQGV